MKQADYADQSDSKQGNCAWLRHNVENEITFRDVMIVEIRIAYLGSVRRDGRST